MENQLSCQTLERNTVYDNPWIRLEEHQEINPVGLTRIYGKVHFKNRAIGLVALHYENYIYLVGQHWYTLHTWSWDMSEGRGWHSCNPLVAAQRELREETGISAAQLELLLHTHFSNSVSDEEGFTFLARGLSHVSPKREHTEADMTMIHVPLAEVLQKVKQGEITNSLSVMGILMAARIFTI